MLKKGCKNQKMVGFKNTVIAGGIYPDGNVWFFRTNECVSANSKYEPQDHYGNYRTWESAKKAQDIYVATHNKKIPIVENERKTVGRSVDNHLKQEKLRVEITTLGIEKYTYNKYLLLDYGDYQVSDFFKTNVYKKLKQRILNAKLTTGTKNKIFTYLRSWAKYCSLSNLIQINILNRFLLEFRSMKDRDKHTKKNRFFCEMYVIKEWLEKIKEIDPQMYVLLRFQIEIGGRISEVRGELRKHHDPINKTITIEQQAIKSSIDGKTIIKGTKSVNSDRVILISDELNNILIEYEKTYRINNPNAFLFFGQDHPIGESTINRALKYYLKKFNMPKEITFHTLRMLSISYLYDRVGLTPRSIGAMAKRYGQSEFVQISSYLNTSGKDGSDIADYFNNNL